MVIFYDEDGYIQMVEHNVTEPTFSDDFTLQDIIDDIREEGLRFAALEEEVSDITSYKVVVDEHGEFERLERLPEEPSIPDIPIEHELPPVSHEERIAELESIIDELLGGE